MKSEKLKGLMLLPVLICALFLSGCSKPIKANGGIAVAAPYVPDPETAKEGDIAAFMIRQQSALKQCNANFEVK